MPRAERSLDILYVGTLPPHPGGSAILAGQILEGFAAAGHRVRAISPAAPGLEEPPVPRGVAAWRFTVPRYETSPDQPSSGEDRVAEGREIRGLFRELVDAARPDVVIIGRESFVWHVAELAREQGLPSVLWMQGSTTWGMLNGSLPESTRQAILAEIRKVDRIVAVAEHMLGALEALGIHAAQAIPNGVDLDRFRPGPRKEALLRSLGIAGDHLVVVHASNMKQLKRPQDLVAAAEIVAGADSRVTWVILGDGPVLEAVRERCRETGLEDSFRFPGWVEHASMRDWLNLADLVVMPSSEEALPLVYLETQACGRVLVASDIPAAREVVSPGDNGLLFPVGDCHRLAGHVLRLGADPDLRTRIGQRARRTVRRHDMRGVVAAHLRVLRELATA